MKMFWGLLLILLGVAFLGDNLRWYDFDFGEMIHRYWPVVLVALGGWMIFEKTRPKKYDFEWTDFKGREFKKTFGDVSLKPQSIDSKGIRVEEGMGDLIVDLSSTALNTGENYVELSLGIGDVKVMLPHGVPASVSVQAGAGDIDVFNNRKDGFGCKLEFTDQNYSSADIKIKVFAKVGLGDVRVSR
ncbi:MAG: cell wall-active antibiotics response protein LiaF [Candidatus Zixiibacteriota bacterium]